MRKIIFYISFFFYSLCYTQEFKFSEDLDAKNVACLNKAEGNFTLFTEYDNKSKSYHINLMVLEDGLNVKKGVFVTKDRLDLVSYHVHENHLILILEVKKMSRERRKKGYVKKKSTEEYYNIVSFDLESNNVESGNQKIPKSKYIFSTDSKTFFLNFKDKKLNLVSVLNHENVKTSSIEFDKKEKEALYYDYNIVSGLSVIHGDRFIETIGVNKPKLFFTEDNIYITKDAYNHKKESFVYKLSLEEGLINKSEFRTIEYPYGKTVKDLNSFLLNDVYYLLTRYRSELNLQMVALDDFNKPIKSIKLNDFESNGFWAEGDVKKMAKKLTNIITPKVPSLMVYKLKNSDEKLVVIDDINKNSGYYNNNFHWQFHQQMVQQQQQAMQQAMQQMQQMNQMRMNMPGGFHVVDLPLNIYQSKNNDLKLEFLVDADGGVSKYNNEKTSLKEYDYEKAHDELEDEIRIKVKKYKKEFVSIDFLEKYKIQYAYFDEKENRLLTGVLHLKED